MNFFTIVVGIILTILATAVLSYISMATMVGPWIAPTLVLFTNVLVKIFRKKKAPIKIKQEIISIQAIAAGGGIIAVGVGFALPVLYFLDPEVFIWWMKDTYRFHWLISAICLSAGSLGIFLGRHFTPDLIDKQKLPFPVSKLTYKVMIVKSQLKQTLSMFAGVLSALVIGFLRDGARGFSGILPKTIYFFQNTCGKVLAFSIWPAIWAIGYTIGPVITLPLFVGLISRYAVLYPLNQHSTFLPISLFEPKNIHSFVTAFCSGLVLSELIISNLKNPSAFILRFKRYAQGIGEPIRAIKTFLNSLFKKRSSDKKGSMSTRAHDIIHALEPFFAFSSTFAILWHLNFSIPAQIALVVFTIIATYEISLISAEIGLLQLGRFSAFVLIPMMLIFKLNFSQITAVCVFFNICAAACSDYLFDCKTGSFCSIPRSQLHLAQWIGLLVTSISIGFILYLLFTQLQLGSDELFAPRGQSKALLIQSLNLDIYVVSLGFLYGIVLKKLRISPTMTFGGIIMPSRITFGLIIGGLISLLPRNKEKYIPFCSGVFASGALWVLISIILRLL